MIQTEIIVQDDRDVIKLFDDHAYGVSVGSSGELAAGAQRLNRIHLQSLIKAIGLVVSEREFQTVCKTLLLDEQGVSKEAFLAWWRKQALPYRKRAQMVGNGLASGIKKFRRGSLAQQHANLRRSSLAVKNSLHKRPPKRLDLTLNPAVKTVGTPMGLSTFQELDEVKEEEEAEEVGEEEEEGGAKR